MALDLDAIPAAARKAYIRVGRHFSSHDTLAQANQTLTALSTRASSLALAGFTTQDADELTAARNALQAADVGREGERGNHKQTSLTYVRAMDDAKGARLQARSILEIVHARLHTHPAPEALGTADALVGVLGRTRTAGADGAVLCTQLELLKNTLNGPLVAEVARERGGPAVLTTLATTHAALDSAMKERATVPGTPEHTERLDVLDGLIIRLVREARRAARSASRLLGQPSLAKEFELTKLYPHPRKHHKNDPGDPPPSSGG
jgi:hypothetical protein